MIQYIICNAPEPYQIYFQNGGSYIYRNIIYLHDYIQFYLLIVLVGVSWIFGVILLYYRQEQRPLSNRDLNHGTWIEIIWTLLPAIVLVLLAIPSFRILYSLEELSSANVTVKCVGAQWYWKYEISDYIMGTLYSTSFDSYMIPTDELEFGSLRLMEVDNVLVLPVNTMLRFLVTSIDVIHSWSVPSIGIKVDAVPGRLNQFGLYIDKPGYYYGACQEICGINHAYMPIKIKATDPEEYLLNLFNN